MSVLSRYVEYGEMRTQPGNVDIFDCRVLNDNQYLVQFGQIRLIWCNVVVAVIIVVVIVIHSS